MQISSTDTKNRHSERKSQIHTDIHNAATYILYRHTHRCQHSHPKTKLHTRRNMHQKNPTKTETCKIHTRPRSTCTLEFTIIDRETFTDKNTYTERYWHRGICAHIQRQIERDRQTDTEKQRYTYVQVIYNMQINTYKHMHWKNTQKVIHRKKLLFRKTLIEDKFMFSSAYI